MTGTEAGRRQRFERYIGRMERGEFWLAHEELEALWLERREPVLKGLIHLAAAMLHAARGNDRGALTKARSCRALVGEADEIMGLKLEPVRELVADLAGRAREGRAATLSGGVPMAGWYRGAVDPATLEEVELPYRVRRHEEGYRTGRDPRRRDD